MSDNGGKFPIHSVESDEDYYFEINITRSQLSDIICRNEDCEAAQKFGKKGIGPFAPAETKDPYECYVYYPPPEKKDTKTIATQSPRKFPCGSSKCKYLNVFPDGTPIGCGLDICKYKKSICDNPECDMNKYTVQAVCGLCGGYSVSGKTCTTFDCTDTPIETKERDLRPSKIEDSPPSKQVCNDICSKPPEPPKQRILKPPVSLLPFDQLHAAARKERLVTLVDIFKEVLGRLHELIMYALENHFDIFNPHIDKTTGHRGQVWANNKFYVFYVDSGTIVLKYVGNLLKDIWNESVRTKSATVPKPLPVDKDFPQILLPSCQNAARDTANFIVNNLGMKASFNHFQNYILSIFETAVVSNKNNIPPLEIPNSPTVSRENFSDVNTKKRTAKDLYAKLTPENFHIKVVYGHKYCIPPNQNERNVPKDMGWLWNFGEIIGNRLPPLRCYQPGAVSAAVAKIIKEHKMQASGAVSVKKTAKKKKPVEVIPAENEAMLSVIKKQGCYMIKMVPCNNPWEDDNKDYSPLVFIVTPKRDKILRVNPDGTEDAVLECDCNSETSASEEEFEIQYTPPVLMMERPPMKMNRTQITQYNLNDTLLPATKVKKPKKS